ncbi:MAG: low molecular weight phosphotyrosine protein phosphatase [Treponema sp.]|nr:low molecular weight phosphotyrosine protein phosphatase [Treponema sp.]
MYRILFICHGNICRSPMAEFVMKHLVAQAGRAHEFQIASAATSSEELGNDTHRGTRAKLDEMGVPYKKRAARKITPADYDRYDLLIGMDDENIYYMHRIFGDDSAHKMHKLLEYCGLSRDVADPWYTGDFDATWNDVYAGCKSLLMALE